MTKSKSEKLRQRMIDLALEEREIRVVLTRLIPSPRQEAVAYAKWVSGRGLDWERATIYSSLATIYSSLATISQRIGVKAYSVDGGTLYVPSCELSQPSIALGVHQVQYRLSLSINFPATKAKLAIEEILRISRDEYEKEIIRIDRLLKKDEHESKRKNNV